MQIIQLASTTDPTPEISGAAEIDIKEGQVKSADYLISGAGKIKAFGLQTLSTSASLSGASKMELTATEKLKVGLSGAGTVKYKGHPVITRGLIFLVREPLPNGTGK